jgi:acyl carrier protein
MQEHTETLRRLKALVVDRIDVDPTQLVPEAKLTQIGLDSFSLIELVFLVEEEFDIKISIDQLEVETVGDVLNVIDHARLGA